MAPVNGLYLHLDRGSSVPVYLQLKHHIVYLIGSGSLKPGTVLPPVRQLARSLGLSTATVQHTYKELEAQGVLVGEAGRAVHVADLTPNPPALDDERAEVLRRLFAKSVSSARSLGFTEDEILHAVGGLIAPGETGLKMDSVVYLAHSPEYADHYATVLRDALADLPFSVEASTFSELERRGEALLDELEPIRCLVSIAGSFAELRQVAEHRGTALFPLVFDVTEDTQEALMNLPRDVPIGLVAEAYLMATRRSNVEHYYGTQANLVCASQTDEAAVRRVVAQCPIIIYALGARRALAALAPPTTRLIELSTRPNPGSLARLRGLLGQQRPTPNSRPLAAPRR
jgi:GntR family transcriptional regulator